MATHSASRRIVWLVLLCIQIWPLDSKLAWFSTDEDAVTPNTQGHDPSHPHRHFSNCQHIVQGRRTYETWPSSRQNSLPVSESTVFISNIPGGKPRWVQGHMTFVHDPLRTVSVLEPGGPGGCKRNHRVTVQETAETAGCLYAMNAGFFNTTTDGCLGNIVSDGRLVRDGRGVQNAQFGIRRDGTLVFGYLSQEDVLDQLNPFVQLVSGVIWLLRDGEININQSLKAECNKLVDREVFRDFVDLLSARTAVGHDAEGNLVLFHVDGQTNERGMDLWEVAEFLKKNGVINAINLDGGGSSSFVINGTLVSYPPDICKPDSRWRCARPVSTVLCVHQRRCQPANCNGHGKCVDGHCRCQDGWQGDACDSFVCHPAACGPHGVCTPGGCVCDAGWRGKSCSKKCLPGYYGVFCRQICICFNGASCNHVSGRCRCLPGFHGNFCQCLVEKMITLQTQQEDAHRDTLSPSEQTWLIITLALALFLLTRLTLHSHWVRRRWCSCSYSFSQLTLSDVS
ncbi:N-acetylglucosamine-1-phosphodiester alpha-N-acetylglucosaminidase-like [Xyrichtys novacula]|uniref:N-acetylglucosamine-1-phosphodiester alpha-N-acetylglucosaminidase-like n=2 Tax=Xyrichtys novacula TaxID=13765 RepID=A0AAV1FQ67_XYRNO|nr:N-acetylglucosamine-1-phosphodiester alpha-N-acetylglucosaminidase-like [Xyrichtys novacula]